MKLFGWAPVIRALVKDQSNVLHAVSTWIFGILLPVPTFVAAERFKEEEQRWRNTPSRGPGGLDVQDCHSDFLLNTTLWTALMDDRAAYRQD